MTYSGASAPTTWLSSSLHAGLSIQRATTASTACLMGKPGRDSLDNGRVSVHAIHIL